MFGIGLYGQRKGSRDRERETPRNRGVRGGGVVGRRQVVAMWWGEGV